MSSAKRETSEGWRSMDMLDTANERNASVNSRREEESTSRASEENVLPEAPSKPFVGTFRMFEKHGTTLYGCAFNQFLDSSEEPIAAVVGGTRVHLYKFPPCGPYGDIIEFKDVNLEFKEPEELYTVAWCQIAADEYRLVFGGESGRLYVMDDRTMKVTKNLVACGGAINDIRTSPTNSKLFAIASKDKSVRVFDVRADAYLLVFGGPYSHLDSVLSVDWTPDGSKIVSCGFDNYVYGWDLSTKEIQDHLAYCSKYLDENKPIERIRSTEDIRTRQSKSAFDPEGYTKQFHTPSNLTRHIHYDYVDCIRAITRGWGTYFITKGCGRESLLRCWRFGTYGDLTENPIPGEPLTCHVEICTKNCTRASAWFNKFAIDPKNEFIVAGGDWGDLYFHNFDANEQEPIYTVKSNSKKETTRQVAFSNDGKIILAVGDKGLMCRLDRVPEGSKIYRNFWQRL
ncbi:unnamed protein product [Caenorhabditis brenneri]